jgi:hypothetical protein
MHKKKHLILGKLTGAVSAFCVVTEKPSVISTHALAAGMVFLTLAACVCVVPKAPAEVLRNFPAMPVMKDGNWDSLRITWTQPDLEKNIHGVHIGNNFIGAIIKGGIGTETLLLNDKTFWSGGPVIDSDPDPKRKIALDETRQKLASGDIAGADAAAKGMWGKDTATYLPLGILSLKFDHGDKATGYLRTLDLDRAIATVKYEIDGVSYTREYFASYPDRVIVMRIRASQPSKISFTAELKYPKEMQGHGASVSTVGSDLLMMKGRAPSNDGKYREPKGMTFESLVKIRTIGGTVHDQNGALRVEVADEAVLFFADATSYNGSFKEPDTQGLDPHLIVTSDLAKASAKNYDQLVDAHVKDYQSLFRRLWMNIGGPQPNQYAIDMQYARYDMISCSRTGDRPHNQQGMWSFEWRPMNRSSHFLNENVEKYYGIIETANLADCGEPLWNWMDELANSGAVTSKIDWGFHGWLAPQSSDIWATTCLKPGRNDFAIWPMGGAWLCNNLWDHYAFGMDVNFLRNRAYPLMKGSAEFCLDYLVDDGHGHLVTSPSTSPENFFKFPGMGPCAVTPGVTSLTGVCAVSQGSTMDLALIRALFQNCIQASETLKVDEDFRRKLRLALGEILPFQINRAGELQEWSQDFEEAEKNHRHASHLISVWPLSQITERDTPELFKAAKTSLTHRGNGGWHPDKLAMWARLKEGDLALRSFNNSHSMTGYWSILCSGIPEMLLFSHNRDANGAYELELLPALPTSWRSGKIQGLRGRGGYEVAIEWKDGQLARCRIDSLLGTMPAVRYQGKLLDLVTDSRVTLNVIKPKSGS